MLSDANENIENHSLSQADGVVQSTEPVEQQNELQLEDGIKHQIDHPPPPLMRGGQMFGAPMMPPPPPNRALFPQITFQPAPVQSHFPIQIGHRPPFQPLPGQFLTGPFPHQIQYAHPPELYQVRSSVPPPPPPPIPSLPALMPPGVDAPMCSINTMISVVTTTAAILEPPVLPVHTITSHLNHLSTPHPPIVNSMPPMLHTQDLPLLPPGVETDIVNEKPLGISPPPPPPMPPLPPCIEDFKPDPSVPEFNPDILDRISEEKMNYEDDINEMKTIGHTNDRSNQDGHFNLHDDSHDSLSNEDGSTFSNRASKQYSTIEQISNPDGFERDRKYHRESKKRKRSSRTANSDIKLDHFSSEHLSSDIFADLGANNSNHADENYQQLNPQASTSQTLSPFDQINQTLLNKSMPGPSSSSSSSLATTPDSTAPLLPSKIIAPGKDLQLVIDRLALYVAKNGEEFEVGIKEKSDPRFDFLNPWNIYHPYYSTKKKVNLEQVAKDKRKEEERRKNLKVKFGLKTKVKPVSVAQKKAAVTAAAVFNQNDEEEEDTIDTPVEGFQPNKDPEVEVKRKLQKQIEEKERLLKQLHEQALLQQKIAEVNRQASIKPMLQNLTPQQQAMLKKKVHDNLQSKTSVKQDERKKRAASFVGMLKKNAENTNEESNDIAGNFLRKRHFKETSSSKDNSKQPPDKANYEKKKDAFFKAINDAFKGT